MAEIRSQDKRDKLRLLYALCKPEGKSLQDLLLATLAVCDEAINDGGAAPGTFLSSTSENGGSAGFSVVSGYGPIVAKRMLGEMNDAYDAAVAKLTECNGQAPADAQIYAYMMTVSFRSIRKFRSDFTGGRYGVGYHLNQ